MMPSRFAGAVVLLWLLLAAPAAPCRVAQTAAGVRAQDGFVPVDAAAAAGAAAGGAAGDRAPTRSRGSPSSVYLWSLWRRLGRVERELADVSRRVERRRIAGDRSAT